MKSTDRRVIADRPDEPLALPATPSRKEGRWSGRVAFGQGFGYRPGEVLVVRSQADVARRLLARQVVEGFVEPREATEDDEAAERHGYAPSAYVRFVGVHDPLATAARLRDRGIDAQLDHVLLAHASFGANPFYANPFYANPFYANPFYANPFYANPFYANPFYANPGGDGGPHRPWAETGRRESLVRPTSDEPRGTPLVDGEVDVRITILDTGWPATHAPPVPPPASADVVDRPDGDDDGLLDPVAGHGVFIAGLVRRALPGCWIDLRKVVEPYGDADERTVAAEMRTVAISANERTIVSLSLGGHSPTAMGDLIDAVNRLHAAGAVVVASAGNDGMGVPSIPAALPHVVAVGALDAGGVAAPFTNHGPWVRAAAYGVEIVSDFFEGFDGARPGGPDDRDEFRGRAVWSGTSFAAPKVAAAIGAVAARAGIGVQEAARRLLDDGDGAGAVTVGERIPGLGRRVEL